MSPPGLLYQCSSVAVVLLVHGQHGSHEARVDVVGRQLRYDAVHEAPPVEGPGGARPDDGCFGVGGRDARARTALRLRGGGGEEGSEGVSGG